MGAHERLTFRARRRALGAVAVLAFTSLAFGLDARAQQDEPPDLTAEGLVAASRVKGAKTAPSQLAETDPELLGRTDATPVDVVIKLDHDSVATYEGRIDGLAATSPAVTGRELTGKTIAERRYARYLAANEASFRADLAATVPQARVGQSLRAVYGGVAATVPANRIEDVLDLPGVVAVQKDELHQPTTDSSPEFIGAPALYPDGGGAEKAGAGVIVGVLDTGAWPEHPSFADQGITGSPPTAPSGAPRACDFGDNPLTPAADPFVCNNKLIAGRPFLATYLSNPARAAAEPFHTARDSNGHGTHTGSTAAGNMLDSAPVFGVERGPIKGVAPGAWVAVYKVCGIQGCFASDSAAAVQQAILDGVDVINFSISGGTSPFTDPAELAFLDAYAAGVFVAASAGNAGPGAGTVNHVSPWVTTVAASTQQREFQSTLTVTAGGDTFTAVGASITAGVAPAPVVLSSEPPYSNELCTAPAPAGIFTGKIVACQRGLNARVEKSFNVLQGGAVGMILYNPTLADVETDNHWIPTVHLANGQDFVAFMNSHSGEIATFTTGAAADGQADVMAAFSSRGPGGDFLKPDISAPGVQILAGHTPFPESIVEGPPGQTFQAIAGTSMSSPHVAGSAALMAARHPTWTPGQIKSALMSTSTTDVVKEDLTTPADPFDMGAGRVDLAAAAQTGLTLDETADRLSLLGGDPLNTVHLNLPSINVPVLPGRVVTTRTVTNVTSRRVRYDVAVDEPDGTNIIVKPGAISIGPGKSQTLIITIEVLDADGQQFGAINLEAATEGLADQHLPVGFVPGEGSVTLMSDCEPDQVDPRDESVCTITAQNNAFTATTVDLTTTVNKRLRIEAADGAVLTDQRTAEASASLDPISPGIPSVAPGESPAGYLPLVAFGVTPEPIGDEEILNFTVPPFRYNGTTYNSIGVDSNGYAIVGGGTSVDNNCCNLPAGPSPDRPNNVLAPFWTDLDGTGAPGIFAATLTDGVGTWLVIEWQVNVFGTTSNRHFQIWIGLESNGPGQDISFTYDPIALPADPNGQAFLVGAENQLGVGDMEAVLPTQDLRVTSTDPVPGGSKVVTLTLSARSPGTGLVDTEMTSPTVLGVTTARSTIEIG